MNMRDIPVPEVYKAESADFRFFIEWFAEALERTQYDIENMIDLYDPLRCPAHLLWMLADTMGFKYDDRLPTSFNRLVLVYFMSMIKLKGSKLGILLAAETNLKQFDILDYIKEHEIDDIYHDRLEDTTLPVNSVYVMPHVEKGYIDVVYYSENRPIDACIEYVRPLGMYLFQHAGVRFDAKSRISVDARLTNTNNMYMSIGPTHVGHYSREDYAAMQRMFDEPNRKVNIHHKRHNVWYRNSDYEGDPSKLINPGYRSLYSLQLANNEHILHSLLPNADMNHDPDNNRHDPERIFSLGYGPQDVDVTYTDDYLAYLNDGYQEGEVYDDRPLYNLRYDRKVEEDLSPDVYTVDDDRSTDILNPRPAVNPIMSQIGDAVSLNKYNTAYADNPNPRKDVQAQYRDEEKTSKKTSKKKE